MTRVRPITDACVLFDCRVSLRRPTSILNFKDKFMKTLIALLAVLSLSVAVAADAKKEEAKKDAPKTEAAKPDNGKKPVVRPVGKDGKPVEAPKGEVKTREAKKADPVKK